MALPNTGITTTMVGQELGISTRNVGNLCRSGAINKWSKWKPVRFNTQGNPLTQANLEAVNYGIGWNSYANIDAVKLAYENNDEVLFYNKPRGGLYNEGYRLGDFRFYEHNAIGPIAGGFVTQQAESIKGGQNSITGSVFINGNPKAGEISWDDLGMGNRKLAMALYYRDNLVKTAVATNVGDTSVTINTRSPLPVLSAGTYNAFLFFTNNAGTTASALRGLPNHSKLGYSVKIVSNTVSVTVKAIWSTSNSNQMIIVVEGINRTGATVSLLNCNLRVRSHENLCTSTIQQGEVVVGVPSTLSLPATGAGLPATIYSTTVTVNREMFPAWKVCWSNTGAYPNTFEAAIIQEM